MRYRHRQAANSTHMQHNDWYFLYCSVTSSPPHWLKYIHIKNVQQTQPAGWTSFIRSDEHGCVQLCAVLHIHIVFKADAALCAKIYAQRDMIWS